jgi:trypsin
MFQRIVLLVLLTTAACFAQRMQHLKKSVVFLYGLRKRGEQTMKPLVLLLTLMCPAFAFSQDVNLDEILMQTTLLVKGPAQTGETLGTTFLLLRPFSAQPVPNKLSGRVVLVTAAHVLEGMTGDIALITVRVRDASGTWTPKWAKLDIRRNGKPLWTGVPNSDVAVMYVSVPKIATFDNMVPTTLLADDEGLTKANAGPGIELKVLGYPLGLMNVGDFPILRTGMIASYPLLPTTSTKTFLLDFKVFKGNSGGPVYYSPREMQGGTSVCCPPKFIMGLVSKEASVTEAYSEFQLSLGIIIHASLIKASIDMLPNTDAPNSETNTSAMTLLTDEEVSKWKWK